MLPPIHHPYRMRSHGAVVSFLVLCKTAPMRPTPPRVLTLSPKELVVLELLIHHTELYGLQLVAKSGGELKRGTIYVTLSRMEDKGFITATPDAPPPGAGGLPRPLYRATALGHRMFTTWTSGATHLVPELVR